MSKNPYYRHRSPGELISHCVWLYNCFSLSFRDIDKMMLYRVIEVTYETIRDWNDKFASHIARQIRRHRPKASHKWHLDEMRVESYRQAQELSGGDEGISIKAQSQTA